MPIRKGVHQQRPLAMTKAKKTRKVAVAKKIISPKDTRVKSNMEKAVKKREEAAKADEPRQVEQVSAFAQ